MVLFCDRTSEGGFYGGSVLKKGRDKKEEEAAFKRDDVVLDCGKFGFLAGERRCKAVCTHSIMGCDKIFESPRKYRYY